MRRGSICVAPSARPGPKTGRHYGAAVCRLRRLLAGGARLSQPKAALRHLAERGEAEVAQPGRPGRYAARPAIYVLRRPAGSTITPPTYG